MDWFEVERLWRAVEDARQGSGNVWNERWTGPSDKLTAIVTDAITRKKIARLRTFCREVRPLRRDIAVELPDGCRYLVSLVQIADFIEGSLTGIRPAKDRPSKGNQHQRTLNELRSDVDALKNAIAETQATTEADQRSLKIDSSRISKKPGKIEVLETAYVALQESRSSIDRVISILSPSGNSVLSNITINFELHLGEAISELAHYLKLAIDALKSVEIRQTLAELGSRLVTIAKSVFAKVRSLLGRMWTPPQAVQDIEQIEATFNIAPDAVTSKAQGEDIFDQPPAGFNMDRVFDLIRSGQALPEEWRSFVFELKFEDDKIDDLGPLSGLSNLRSLSVRGLPISDLSPLSRLYKLETLDLGRTRVVDLSPIANLSGLRELTLNETKITDLSPLASLSNLQILDLGETPSTDLSPLASLASLKELTIDNTPVAELLPLTALNLETLSARNTAIRDITSLAQIASLKKLNLSNNPVTDLTPLRNLTNLTDLDLDRTSVRDVSALATLNNLDYLILGETNVTDISPLAGLLNLRRLALDNTRVTDVTPLSKLEKLMWLSLRDTKVADLAPVSHVERIITPGRREIIHNERRK